MDRRELIARGLDYIEENLKSPITAQELADMAGYSLYRYYRLFQSATGMPVMRYILRRRLMNAVFEIQCGRSQIDAALMYGFDTHSGFYRAFLREFGCTPSQYIKSGKARRPVPPCLAKEAKMNEANNTPLGAVSVADFYSDPKKALLAGRAIGRLHLKLKDSYLTVDEVELYETVAGWALPVCRGILELRDEFCRDYLEKLAALCPRLPTQIIHRDPNPSMFVITPEGWKLTPSPLTERNVRIYDPCYAATAVLSESFGLNGPRDPDEWLRIYRDILAGYSEIAGLTGDERRAVPFIVLANQFICTAWFFEQNSEPKLYDVNKRMTTWLISIFDKLSL